MSKDPGLRGPLGGLCNFLFPKKCDKIYRQVSNIRRTLVGNEIVDHSDVVGASPVGTAPTTFSFSTWLHWIGQRQLQDETRHIQVWEFGASYIRDFMVHVSKFSPQNGILHKSIIHVVFMTMRMNVTKENIFIYRWNIDLFYIFAHTFSIMSLTWHVVLATNWTHFAI